MVTAGLLSRARAGDGEAFRELTGPHRCVRLIADADLDAALAANQIVI